MANYPQVLAQDAVCQSHTGHMAGLWFLPALPLRLNTNERMNIYIYMYRGKSIPLQAWSGPEVSRKLRFVDYMTTAQDGGKVVSLTHRPPLPQEKYIYICIKVNQSHYRPGVAQRFPGS